MLQSVRDERARNFKMALRIGIPVLLFVFALAYGVFFREDPIALTPANMILMGAMLFTVVYFIYFALELSRRETLLDRVTGGYHYEAFIDRIHRNRPPTLAAIQVANLGVINENFGVGRADRLLRLLVERLDRDLLGPLGGKGCVGRKNGAEFLLGIDAEPQEVERALERFAATHPELEGIEVEFAFAVIRNNIDDPERAVDQLRDLLIQKESRGPRSDDPVEVSDARELSESERKVIEALRRKDLFLQFRPLLNLRKDRRDLYEIAVKMRAKDGSLLPPRTFLPIINRHNFGIDYDLLIVERVLECARLSDEEISLSFNLSPFSLRNERFLEEFRKRLIASEVRPERLIVELYERKSHHRLEEYFKRLKDIKRWGVRLCLDNFGSSNASMEYLRHFPFDMIQFDREYTVELDRDGNLSILRSFVAMAHEMGMLSGAKWVDSADKIVTLKGIDVDYIQGFAAGRVLSEEEFVSLNNPIKERIQ